MMSKTRKRIAGRIPQNERRLSVVSEDRTPIDLDGLADLIVMHALGRCHHQASDAEEIMMFNRHLPRNRAPQAS